MKKLLIISLLFSELIFFSSFKTSKDCKSYFEGKWKYDDLTVEQMYVVRTLNKQTEYIENGKYYYDFDIDWTDNCSYKLTYKGTNSPYPAASDVGETLRVEIISIGKDSMGYKTNFRDQVELGKMTKIK